MFKIYVTDRDLILLLKGNAVEARVEKYTYGAETIVGVDIDHTWVVGDYRNNSRTMIKIRKPSLLRRIFG